MRALLALLICPAVVVLVACKDKAPPPPIANGKCLVDSYNGTKEDTQTCLYEGYEWHCAWSNYDEKHSCKRGKEAGGERR